MCSDIHMNTHGYIGAQVEAETPPELTPPAAATSAFSSDDTVAGIEHNTVSTALPKPYETPAVVVRRGPKRKASINGEDTTKLYVQPMHV